MHVSDIKRGGSGYLDPLQDRVIHAARIPFVLRDWGGRGCLLSERVIEHALAHKLKDKAEAAYQRGTLLAKRARLMEEWASYCSVMNDDSNKIIPFDPNHAR